MQRRHLVDQDLKGGLYFLQRSLGKSIADARRGEHCVAEVAQLPFAKIPDLGDPPGHALEIGGDLQKKFPGHRLVGAPVRMWPGLPRHDPDPPSIMRSIRCRTPRSTHNRIASVYISNLCKNRKCSSHTGLIVTLP